MRISRTDRARNGEILHRDKDEKNILHTANGRKTTLISHILGRNCLLKYVIEGKIGARIEVTGRRERRRWQIVDEGKERILENERGSGGSHSVEDSLWKRLWTCRKTDYSGFGGIGVACCLQAPKFAGSNPAEAVRIFQGEKNPQHAFLRKGSKAVGPMS